MSATSDIREYAARARSTDTFGRVMCSCRDHHFVADGPVWNGCPGEEVTPGELFLAGLAACAVELLEVTARERGVAVPRALVAVDAGPLLARRFVARAERPATPCARLRCAPSAAARVNVRPHSGHTNSPLAVPSVWAAARLLLARFFAAGCLFDVAIASFLTGRRNEARWTPYVTGDPSPSLGRSEPMAKP